MSAAQGSIVVRAPIGNVYQQWLRIEDFPKFMPAVKKVQKLDVGHFSIVVSLNGKRHKAVFEIMLQVPERRVAWRALAGRPSEHFVSGVVSFTSQPDQSTCVILKICPGFDGAVSRRMHSYLRNFKRFMEHPGVLEHLN
ncbi:MAG TPA: SRPBCC family protein [Candidatus Polarisedimenticolia bacterium]|nr:SRPBCC family protein [Candidatus Polarisedimenticolia bacterium]